MVDEWELAGWLADLSKLTGSPGIGVRAAAAYRAIEPYLGYGPARILDIGCGPGFVDYLLFRCLCKTPCCGVTFHLLDGEVKGSSWVARANDNDKGPYATGKVRPLR